VTPAAGGGERVGVVILNWNRFDDTAECLRSVLASDHPEFEAIVVDNGSTNGSADRLARDFPGLTLIRAGANLGYAGGNNLGLKAAFDRGSAAALVLNNDAIIEPSTISRLVIGAADPAVGIAGPKIYFYGEPDRLWSAGGYLREPWDVGLWGSRRPDGARFEGPHEVDWVTGCALLIKREVVERIGLMDEGYFLLFEETEWCVRARKAGFKVVCLPQARAWHKVSSSFGGAHSASYYYYFTRNQFRFIRRNLEVRRAGAYARAASRQARWLLDEFRRGEPDAWSKAFAALAGAWDFARGKEGAR